MVARVNGAHQAGNSHWPRRLTAWSSLLIGIVVALVTTQRYVHLAPAMKRTAVESLCRKNRKPAAAPIHAEPALIH